MTPQFMFPIVSAPQTNLRNRTIPVSIAKIVGGGSAINAMMTVRGTSEDYDRWGGFFGNSSSWSWKGMLPYFKKALNFVPPNDDVAKSANITYDTSYWGNTSGVYASWPSFQYPGATVQLDAFRGLDGITFPPDSGAGQTGVYWFPQFVDPKNVTRSYATTGHWDNLNRTNYFLMTESKVNRIVLNGTTAVGVTFIPVTSASSNVTQNATFVRANKEVILAAGTIHNPQIMQISGLGPKKLLDAANITTIVDLPGVGQNFQDHTTIATAFACGCHHKTLEIQIC